MPPSVLTGVGREGQAKSTTAAKAPSKSAETARRRRSAGRPFLYVFHLTRHLTSDLTLDTFHGLFTFVLLAVLAQLLVCGRENWNNP